MHVREGMSTLVLTVGPGHTLRQAAAQMAERNVGAAVVLDPDAMGPGIITERDILLSLGRGEDPDREKVADLLLVRVLARCKGLEDVALGDDPGSLAVGVDRHRRADAALGHVTRRRAERMTWTDGQDDGAHPLAYLHLSSRFTCGSAQA